MVTQQEKMIRNLEEVNVNNLFMFPEIDKQHNDYIQFDSGKEFNNPDVSFIWDLKNKKPIETLEKPN
jgi:hypothetical protein